MHPLSDVMLYAAMAISQRQSLHLDPWVTHQLEPIDHLMFLRPWSIPMWILSSCLICPPNTEDTVEKWARQVKCSLQYDATIAMPKKIRRALLDESENDFEKLVGIDESEEYIDWVVKGVPRRPLYKEIAFRLVRWNQQIKNNESLLLTEKPKVMVSAKSLGFEEIKRRSLASPPRTHQEVRHWMRKAGLQGILQLLGVRSTVGSATNSLLSIPTRSALMEASRAIHHPNSALTVAARARTKHAHRGKDNFFGIAKGSPPIQNEQTEKILQNLLDEAVWMNVHSFGGVNDDKCAFEIRVESGYGARWVIHSRNKELQFRGFLEPQMDDGHEKRWRH